MDIRNIKGAVPEVSQENILQEIYKLGIEQFEGYRNIEKLPVYPLDINNSKSQVILKDFIGRVIEELTEGFESTDAAVTLTKKYGWNIDNLTEEEYQEVLNHLANANEEQADAIGFYITLLAYSSILPEDILSYKNAKSLFDVMAIGVKEILISGESEYPGQRIGYCVIHPSHTPNYESVIQYTPGFHNLNEVLHEDEKLHLFDVIYELNKARNLLKSRPWKQTQVMTKELDYQEALVKSFYLYMGFLALNGFTDENLFRLFYKKQRLNLWRQNTNY